MSEVWDSSYAGKTADVENAEYACDLKELYPDKEITLLHSRTRLMPIYPIEVHVNSECTFPEEDFLALLRD